MGAWGGAGVLAGAAAGGLAGAPGTPADAGALAEAAEGGLGGTTGVPPPPAGVFDDRSASGLELAPPPSWEPGFQPLHPPWVDRFFRLPWTCYDCGESLHTAIKG